VRPLVHGPEHRKPLRGDLEAMSAEHVPEVVRHKGQTCTDF